MPNFNAFMHRRNIFRKEPDFNKLACDYQELRQFMTFGSRNKLKFDFKNPDALRALTCALLHRYFQKRITLPADRMIPAVPQRLNYICWVEDLVKLLETQEPDLNVIGFDIGTGASCIFPILGCHRNPTWSFVGVEADAKSHSIAVENVQKNFMEDRIRLVKITTEDTLSDILCLSCYPITFIMCNPPFFEEEYGITLEINPNIRTGRPKSGSNTSEKIESITEGGEISFVGHMLEQSRHLKEEVTIYTSMLGRKQSLIHFKQTLSSLNEESLSWTWAELCQGKTIRYAIAWTFKPGLDLTKAPPLRHGKNKSWKFKLIRKMPKRDCQLELLENGEFLKRLVSKELMINRARVTRQTSQTFEMLIKTNDRTWSNQRRKRREQANKHKYRATLSSMGFQSRADCGSVDSPQTTCLLDDPTSNPLIDCNAQMVCDGDSSAGLQSVVALTNQNEVASGFDNSSQNAIDDTEDVCLDMNADLYDQEIMATLRKETKIRQKSSQDGSDDEEFSPISPVNSKKRKNPSSCSSSPSRLCPSPNEEQTDDDNQSTDTNTDMNDNDDDSMNGLSYSKRICIKDDDVENMDDIYDYLLCCRISLTRICHDLYFELKLEHPCTSANDGYNLFQYFRNKLTDK